VDFIFRLQHPFPPAQQLAERLASRYGFQWSEVRVRTVDRPRWRVTRWFPASPFPNDALVERWRCELWLDGPAGQATKIRGVADVRRGYRLHEGQIADSWDALLAGRLPYLPAGPWTTSAGFPWRSALHPQCPHRGRALPAAKRQDVLSYPTPGSGQSGTKSSSAESRLSSAPNAGFPSGKLNPCSQAHRRITNTDSVPNAEKVARDRRAWDAIHDPVTSHSVCDCHPGAFPRPARGAHISLHPGSTRLRGVHSPGPLH
jgi:hypothetical protein